MGQNKPLVPLVWLDWPAPKNVRACFSLRCFNDDLPLLSQDFLMSEAPFDDFNFGLHVGDQPDTVLHHRQQLTQAIHQKAIHWLTQVHGTDVVNIASSINEADACYTADNDKVCAVMTADCLPVFFCDTQGRQVAVAHAGWRGLASGVLQNTLATFRDPSSVMAYLGPAISQPVFEVGHEVRAIFLQQLPTLATCFLPSQDTGKYRADLYSIARTLLAQQGVTRFYGGDRCTYSESECFYSYRRDGQTGRMANLIWLDSHG